MDPFNILANIREYVDVDIVTKTSIHLERSFSLCGRSEMELRRRQQQQQQQQQRAEEIESDELERGAADDGDDDDLLRGMGMQQESNGIPEGGPGAHLSAVGSAAVRYTLTRMASTPANPTNAATLVSSLLGNLSQQHRRLERTQSAPAPASALPATAASNAVNTSRYKTELCRPYEEFGVCKYGDKCQFAHGMNELRNLARHPKYKTELCRTYHTVGFCPYGPRCHFVHNQEEVAMQRMQSNAAPVENSSRLAADAVKLRTAVVPTISRPAALSPALSIDSASSPPCSLSQSPTSSMGSFFSSEPELHSPGIEDQRLPVFNKLSAPAPLLALSEFL